MTEAIQFGSKYIDFRLEYSDRRTLGIVVHPDSQVTVTAPEGSTLETIKDKLYRRASWIIRQQSFFLSFQPKTTPRKCVNGETHLYLGRQYRLKILRSKVESVKLKGQFLEVSTLSKSRVKILVGEWYLKNARVKFTSLAEPLIQRFKKHSVSPTSVVIRDMPSRWGSCTPRGKIILNPELIKAPRGCIEYVITHELCHLVHHDHTRKFIELQLKEMPDWEKWKRKLELLLA